MPVHVKNAARDRIVPLKGDAVHVTHLTQEQLLGCGRLARQIHCRLLGSSTTSFLRPLTRLEYAACEYPGEMPLSAPTWSFAFASVSFSISFPDEVVLKQPIRNSTHDQHRGNSTQDYRHRFAT